MTPERYRQWQAVLAGLNEAGRILLPYLAGRASVTETGAIAAPQRQLLSSLVSLLRAAVAAYLFGNQLSRLAIHTPATEPATMTTAARPKSPKNSSANIIHPFLNLTTDGIS